MNRKIIVFTNHEDYRYMGSVPTSAPKFISWLQKLITTVPMEHRNDVTISTSNGHTEVSYLRPETYSEKESREYYAKERSERFQSIDIPRDHAMIALDMTQLKKSIGVDVQQERQVVSSEKPSCLLIYF